MRFFVKNGKALLASYEPEAVKSGLAINIDCSGVLRVMSDFAGSPVFIEYDRKSRSYLVPERALVGRVFMDIMGENGRATTLQPLISIEKDAGGVIVIPDASDVLRRLSEAEASILSLTEKSIESEKKQKDLIARIERLFEGYNI